MHADTIEVDYLLDFAELPAWAEIETLDADHDGAVTVPEREAYLRAFVQRIGLTLRVDGRPAPLHYVFQTLEAPPGQDGLSTLRLAYTFRTTQPVTVPADGTLQVTLTDTTWSERNGWREIDVDPSAGFAVVSSSLPRGAPRAGAALGYPASPSSMPREDAATFVFRRDAARSPTAAPVPAWSSRRAMSPGLDRLVGLLRRAGDPHTPGFVAFALCVATSLGAVHALEPGHGKALVGAWLVGARARARDAVLLGVLVTLTHTAVVFVLAIFALTVEHTVGTDRLLRALELTSALFVVGVALRQLRGRCVALRGHAPAVAHDAPQSREAHVSVRGLVAVGVSGGIVPCPSALLVLLTAIGVHHVGLGLGLLGAFSLGLAGVLTLVGLAAVHARDWLERRSWDDRWGRGLALVSSVAVLLLGIGMLARGLMSR